MAPASLTIFRPWRPASVHTLDPDRRYLLGRAADADLQLDEPGVSRHHARLWQEQEQWFIEDLGSKNGTHREGSTPGSALQSGELIHLAELTLRFEHRNDAAERALASRQHGRALRAQARMQDNADCPDPRQAWQQFVLDVIELADAERGMLLLSRPDVALLAGDLRVDERSAAQLAELPPDLGLQLPPPAITLGLNAEEYRGATFAGSRTALALALRSGTAVAISDLRGQQALCDQQSIVSSGLRSLICLPLRDGERVLGAVYADSRLPGKRYTALDLDVLESLTSHAVLHLSAQRLAAQLHVLQQTLL